MPETRIERDSMGEMEVPADALYGASTQRAVLNFPVSGYRFGRVFIWALGLIKHAAAEANERLGKLDPKLAGAIRQAAQEVMDGKHDDQFVVDIFQTGSGTSTNMNANEVIAHRATQILGGKGATEGSSTSAATKIHPNDHVNMGQSSNDVIPTAIHVAFVRSVKFDLRGPLHGLTEALKKKARDFDDIVKIGRTHLMDATPIRLGQVFSGYAAQIVQAERRIEDVLGRLSELPIGGTAVGTGINTHPQFAELVCQCISQAAGGEFREAWNHFEAQATKDTLVEAAGAVKTLAVSLTKIANDIRLMGSGPRCSLGELTLPATQPGSSIMPGKVNPVICESVMQVCAQVVGADAAVTYAAATLGNFELHIGMPVMAYNLLEAVRLLGNVCGVFTEKCIAGLEANRQRCTELIERSLAMCTSLAPLIGYDQAAEIAKDAYQSDKTVRQVAEERIAAGTLKLDPAQLDEALDPRHMTKPQA